jgi:hypothetical protein
MFEIESNASEILANAQTHQVIADKLLAGQAIPGCFIHLPGPGEIFVGNALLGEMAIGLALVFAAWQGAMSLISMAIH